MSDWTTRLPYAHRYITKTWFEGAQADLDLPEVISMVTIYDMGDPRTRPSICKWYSRWSTEVHLERLKSYYYELSISRSVQGTEGHERLSMGYTGNLNEVFYRNDGYIVTDVSNVQSLFFGIPYCEGDTIGCGYEYPSRFFVTKNGAYQGHCIAQLGLNAFRLEMRTWVTCQDCPQFTNLGQRPFVFDIEGHFDKRHARWRSLPLEILETVLQFSLLSQDTNHLLHLSRVCRRWRTLFSRSVFDLSILTRQNLEDVLKILRTRTPIHARNLITQEPYDETWLHRFIASPILYIKSTSTLAIRAPVKRRQYMEKAPSFLSQRVPGILRNTFTEVHTFALSKYSFPTWTRFAQVVFAFKRLETLACSSVTWDTSPPTPPTWLTFSKRLHHASFEDMDRQCIPGSLWLFLAGRPRPPSDDLVLAPSDISIIGQLASLILRPNFAFVYDQKQPQSCTLSSTRQSQSSARIVSDLSFEFEGNDATYQLTRVHARLTRETHSALDDSKIGMYLATLSSADSCHFRFELSGLRYEGGPRPSHFRRIVAKAMMWQHTAGLLECTWNGKSIEDATGAQWMKRDTVVTFGVENTYQRGTSGRLTWYAEDLWPQFHRVGHSWQNVPPWGLLSVIPWVKLYKYDAHSLAHFIADVAFNIAAGDGQTEFLLPEVDPGLYFLAVGDYVYRTKIFEVVQ